MRLSLAVTLAGTGAGLRRGLPDPQELPGSGQMSAEQVLAKANTAASRAGSTGLGAGMGSAATGMHAQRAEQVVGAGEGSRSKSVPDDGIPRTGTSIHTLVTSNGSPYLNFQLRIMCGPVESSLSMVVLAKVI